MGLAASQARFLSLTARLSDTEYETQQISQERLQMTNKMNKYAEDYEAAITNRVAVANVFNNNGQTQSQVALSWDVINGDVLNGGLGMKVVTASGLIVVPNEEEAMKMIESSGSVVVDPETPDGTQTTTTNVRELTMADFFILEEIKDSSVLQKNLEEGNMYLASEKNKETGEWDKKSMAQTNGVTEIYDSTDDAVAKAKYDKLMRQAESTDSMLEMRMSQLDSEHQALSKEMESLEKLIDNDVEQDFKTFG